eukprot:749096-Hanusia_phi.AAC.2
MSGYDWVKLGGTVSSCPAAGDDSDGGSLPGLEVVEQETGLAELLARDVPAPLALALRGHAKALAGRHHLPAANDVEDLKECES